MSDKTALGHRMKGYERRESARKCLSQLPICARIDGKRFSRWTSGLARPYDLRLSKLMEATTVRLVEETQALVGYTQSDEISLLFYSDDPKRQVFLDGRIQKMTSILASMATAYFNAGVLRCIPERAEWPALFDCRVWSVPTRAEAANAFLWRERDATKNSLSMAARHYYEHEQLMNCGADALHELLFEKGVNWNDYPSFFKRGTFVRREVVTSTLDVDEIARLPPRHAARRDPHVVVQRSRVATFEMPPFHRVRNREAVLFEGAAPVVTQED